MRVGEAASAFVITCEHGVDVKRVYGPFTVE